MIVDTTKIVGTFTGGHEVVTVNIGMLCSNEAVFKICDILKEEANNLGESLDLTVTITMEDI
jgi:hypothetical protein